MGENMKFEMVMEFVLFAAPDPVDALEFEPVLGLDEPDPPSLQAARSSAAPRTRTTAPPLSRLAGSRTT
jgi:hypothetical protein